MLSTLQLLIMQKRLEFTRLGTKNTLLFRFCITHFQVFITVGFLNV